MERFEMWIKYKNDTKGMTFWYQSQLLLASLVQMIPCEKQPLKLKKCSSMQSFHGENKSKRRNEEEDIFIYELKIHGTCPGGELDDIVKHLEEATGSVVIGQIGRTVILYRPSLTRMKAEEKKKQNQIIFMKKQKQYAERRSFQDKGEVPRPYARGRRGSSSV
ncbi:hypothetical protein RND71_041847 [Anisodus tanguticus]|uniref:CRM domain-containing protein n=1 Tax=Anisodus tanguticus TaxID=243964 RepID=A0AAE1QVE5_9SOLA|nr:hypothetical protein RND71_041847 [Anisodus tanguticus]